MSIPADAVSRNVTFDDFDAVFTYSNDKDWSTNDPSKPFSSDSLAYRAWDNTYHTTNLTNGSVNFSFRGTDLYFYVESSPERGRFNLTIDGNLVQPNGTYSPYTVRGLNSSTSHQVSLAYTGNQTGNFTLDRVVGTVQLAPASATIVNTTVEDANKTALSFTGHWDSNSDAAFSGGTTTYTNASGASVSLSFRGTAVYLFGDANNDHYAFNVTLDGTTTSHHSPLGCGGNFVPHACEKIQPGLQYFAAYLDNSLHNITVTNWVVPSLNYSYFDLDRFVYTTPSQYLTLPANSSAISAAGGGSSVGTISSNGNNAAGLPSAAQGTAPLPIHLVGGSALLLLLFRFISDLS